jgi:hypothetical protein
MNLGISLIFLTFTDRDNLGVDLYDSEGHYAKVIQNRFSD